METLTAQQRAFFVAGNVPPGRATPSRGCAHKATLS
jgi:hypothetical protein